MIATEIQDWSRANQQYLTGMIKIVKYRLEEYSGLRSNNFDKSEHVDHAGVLDQLRKCVDEMQDPPALDRVVTALNLSAFERDVLLLCAGLELESGMSELIATILGDPSFEEPTFGLALAVLPEAHWSAVTPGGALRYWRLIELNKTKTITWSPIKVDEHILHYLAGIRELNERLKEVSVPVPPEEASVPSQKKLADNILQAITKMSGDGLPPVIHLFGNDPSDIVAVASHVCFSLQSRLYKVSAYSVPVNTRDNTELARLWSREMALNNYVLFLDCSDLENNDKPRIQAVTSFVENIQGLILLNGDPWMIGLKRNKIVFNVERPTAEEQMSLWKKIIGPHIDLNEAGLATIVSQFNLSADRIRKAGFEIFNALPLNGKGHENLNGDIRKKIWKACCTYTRPQVDELAERIIPVATWNDIVLPETQKNVLKEIAVQVKQRNKVYREWGFASKSSRGLGISALFSGESGTGKTMASEVLANELELDLFKIDLSKVVNKYIGETEKNLRKIFDAAEDGGAILLFDEADALFGKRSDVKDSHDRYSNIEVSYLLQRMEAYRGLAILTTNMKNAIDKAFLRRIRFVITFPFPDSIQRAEIWNKAFPDGTPCHQLDMERLARFAIPGGSIRNIALNAAFYAADENRPVEMIHVLKAAKSEYEKMEKPFNTMDIKAWQ